MAINRVRAWENVAYLELQQPSIMLDVAEEKQGLLENRAEDKLLRTLPDELYRYVQHPKVTLDQVMIHPSTTNWVVAGLLCPYAVCCGMILVKEGDIALSWYGDEPLIYGPGRHFLLEPTQSFVGYKTLIKERKIRHGPYHIICVKLGEVGIGIDLGTGFPIILSVGTHIIKSETFKFETFSKLIEEVTEIGELKLIRIEVGFMGFGYRSDGELMLLKPGMHLISPPDRYTDNLSMQVQIVQLPQAVHESKDYVQISVTAAVYYNIIDPRKALIEVGDKLKDQIKDIAIAALQAIIRSSTLVDIAGTSKVTYSQKDTHAAKSEGETDFYAKIHDKFMAELHDHVLEDWGIDINNIRIESLRIHDKALAKSIANQAIQVSELEAKHMMLEKETEIIQVEANNKAVEVRIRVEADAFAITTKAKAEADAVIQSARANKQANILRGEGERQYAEDVNNSGLGAELAKLEIHAKAMQTANQIVYVPHLPSMMSQGNPLFDGSLALPGKMD